MFICMDQICTTGKNIFIKALTKRSQGLLTDTAPARGTLTPSSPRYFTCKINHYKSKP
ncbi:hypothetical protein Hanom_Chr03g00215951 [Helianthus anomalus]